MPKPTEYPDKLPCMICEKEPNFPFEVDEYGDWWVYCKECDCWTAHPTPDSTFGSVGSD